jgi:hypothetical protein
MKNRQVKFILLTIVSAFLLMFLLYYSSSGINQKQNGFKRFYLQNALRTPLTISLNQHVPFLFGSTGSHLYFWFSETDSIWITGYNLSPVSVLKINLPANWNNEVSEILADSNCVFLFSDKIQRRIEFNLVTKKIVDTNMKYVFNRGVLLNTVSAVSRGPDQSGNAILRRIVLESGVANTMTISEPGQLPGFFNNNGKIYYSKYNHCLVYTFNYRNGFLNLDTNFRLLYKGHTIDTVNHGFVLSLGKPGKGFTMASAPIVVNGIGTIYQRYLFIRSMLKSDNETGEYFNANTFVDLYDLAKKGSYSGTLVIPDLDDQKMIQFTVVKEFLIAVYANGITCYQFYSPLPAS